MSKTSIVHHLKAHKSEGVANIGQIEKRMQISCGNPIFRAINRGSAEIYDKKGICLTDRYINVANLEF